MAAARNSRWLQSWPTPLVVGLARVGPIGRLRPGPGTWGSVVGVGYFYGAFANAGLGVTLAVSGAAALLGVALCGEAEKRLGKTDPGEIVLDETLALPFCFLGWTQFVTVAPAWGVLLAGFVLFRIFDIAKPFGIKALQHLPGGWGVMVDDVAAALCTNVVLHALYHGWRAMA